MCGVSSNERPASQEIWTAEVETGGSRATNQLLQEIRLSAKDMWPIDTSMCPWGFAVSAAVGYLLGSLPTAWIIMRFISGKNSDIRSLGDGNVGATNAGRLMGARWGIFVAGLDMAKGYGAISASRLMEGMVCTHGLEQPLSGFAMVAGASAMVGHIWPIWLRFHGGRGAATAVGILGTAHTRAGAAHGVSNRIGPARHSQHQHRLRCLLFLVTCYRQGVFPCSVAVCSVFYGPFCLGGPH